MEKVEFVDNGIRCQVAIQLSAPDPERRAALDQMVMSLPLGAALAVTAMAERKNMYADPERQHLQVYLVPQLYDANEPNAVEMLAATCEVIRQAYACIGGDEFGVQFGVTALESAVAADVAEKLRLPSTKIIAGH